MDSNTSTLPKVDVYSIVTNRIIELLEQGTIPWQQPWSEPGIPMNLISKRPYRGLNLWLLLSLKYDRNLFLTWDQLKAVKGSVKRGEHGHVVTYWKAPKKDQKVAEDQQEKIPPFLKYYKVFNISQCRDLPENLVEPLEVKEFDPIAECERIIKEMKECPSIKFKEPQAYYDPQGDYVNMPKKKTFRSVESYYSVLFHELVHSTGNEKRLNRKSLTEMAEFGSDLYSSEELIAEMGSAYLSAFGGILNAEIGNSTAYIQGWLGKLKGDKRFIVQASGHAQKAVDFILNQHFVNPAEVG